MTISYNDKTGQYLIEVNREEYANLNNGLGCAMRLTEMPRKWNDKLCPSDLECCNAMDKAMLEAYV